MIHIKSRLPTFEEIDKMIEEEFMSSGIVESFNRIEPSDPSVRGKYSTRLNIDEKLDTYETIRAKVKQYVNEVHISTNTGKHGHKGFVTDILKPEDYDTVLCCGPEIMMKKVVDMCKEKNVSVYVSMEKHMACGVGACLVCTCKTKEGNKRTCKDGPIFDGYYVEL